MPVLVVAGLIAVLSTLVIVLANPSTGGGSRGAAMPAPVGAGKPGTVSIDISMFSYSPSKVTIAAGTTVAWTNKDTTEHTATGNGGTAFDTGAIQHGQTKTFMFMKAGTYAYHCAFHPFMTATVIVR